MDRITLSGVTAVGHHGVFDFERREGQPFVVDAVLYLDFAKAAESEDLPPELRNVLSLNVTEMAEMAKQKLGEELNKQIDRVSEDLSKKLPPEVGGALKDLTADPEALKKDPGKAIQQGLGGLLKKPEQAPPATQPK